MSIKNENPEHLNWFIRLDKIKRFVNNNWFKIQIFLKLYKENLYLLIGSFF